MNTITKESLELLKGALAKPDDVLAKSISTASGLLAYDLQAPAKNLYPFIAPLRSILPRIGGGTGTATNWRTCRTTRCTPPSARPSACRCSRNR